MDWLAFSTLLFFGGLVVGLIAVGMVPRVLDLLIEPRRVYPLYGLHFSVQQLIRTLTNSNFYVDLFGDSSYILHYLKFLGYRISTRGQTGSNFGTTLAQDTPFQSGVGEGTMVSDGLVILNGEFSSSSFRVMPVELGARCYLGNRITFPPGARVGDNCLLATKVMVPTDGPLRAGVGLLGSPSFEIPRSVRRDSAFDCLKGDSDFRLRLAAKNRHNLVTMAVFLGVRCLHFLAANLIALAAVDLYHRHGGAAAAMFPLLVLLFSVAYFILAERAVMGFGRLSLQFCSLYDHYFWWHERYWKLLTPAFILDVFNGTPFKPCLWRLLGARVGARLFDDGCSIPERTLVHIGDDCMLNAGTTLQCHSLEDGAFKSDHIVLGSGATVGVGAFVHYGTTFGEGADLDADAFLMKGETIPPGASWGGNPARELIPMPSPEASPVCVPVGSAAAECARA